MSSSICVPPDVTSREARRGLEKKPDFALWNMAIVVPELPAATSYTRNKVRSVKYGRKALNYQQLAFGHPFLVFHLYV